MVCICCMAQAELHAAHTVSCSPKDVELGDRRTVGFVDDGIHVRANKHRVSPHSLTRCGAGVFARHTRSCKLAPARAHQEGVIARSRINCICDGLIICTLTVRVLVGICPLRGIFIRGQLHVRRSGTGSTGGSPRWGVGHTGRSPSVGSIGLTPIAPRGPNATRVQVCQSLSLVTTEL
jgi:hypothetical protein